MKASIPQHNPINPTTRGADSNAKGRGLKWRRSFSRLPVMKASIPQHNSINPTTRGADSNANGGLKLRRSCSRFPLLWSVTATVFFFCATRKQPLLFQKEPDDSGGAAITVPRPTIAYHDKEAPVGTTGRTPSGTVVNVQKLSIQPESRTNITANTKLPQSKQWETTLVTTSTAASTSSKNENVLQVQKDPSGSIFTSSDAAGVIPVKLTNRTQKIVYFHLGKTGGTTLNKVL